MCFCGQRAEPHRVWWRPQLPQRVGPREPLTAADLRNPAQGIGSFCSGGVRPPVQTMIAFTDEHRGECNLQSRSPPSATKRSALANCCQMAPRWERLALAEAVFQSLIGERRMLVANCRSAIFGKPRRRRGDAAIARNECGGSLLAVGRRPYDGIAVSSPPSDRRFCRWTPVAR